MASAVICCSGSMASQNQYCGDFSCRVGWELKLQNSRGFRPGRQFERDHAPCVATRRNCARANLCAYDFDGWLSVALDPKGVANELALRERV